MVTFTCKAGSSITMPKRDAHFLLEIMGQRKVVPGSLLEEDVPRVLKQLRMALDTVNSEKAPNDTTEENSLKTVEPLAQSLVVLLEAAAKHSCNVTWVEVSSLI